MQPILKACKGIRMEKSLLGFCNPLLDITAEVSQKVLEKYGLKANDAILAQENHKNLATELAEEFKVSYSAGGAGQNTIRAAQWLLPPKSTVYVGCIGNDHFGQELKQSAEGDGLTVEYMVDGTTPTGTCAVLLTGHNRSLVANLSAANNYKIDHCKELVSRKVFESVKIFYITGFFLTVSPDTILHVADYALQHKRIFSMNLSAPFLCQFFKEPMLKALPYVDYLFGNESEVLAFSEANNLGLQDIKQIALHLSKLEKKSEKPRVVVITQGADPVIVATNQSIVEYPVPFVPAEEIIDTNGGGDAFVGGFLSQLVQCRSIEECINAGNYAAGYVIRKSGITFPDRPVSLSFK